MQVFYAKATDIYSAAVAGAKHGYNRTTDDCSEYAEELERAFNLYTSLIDDQATRNSVIRSTDGKWKNSLHPFLSLMFHKPQQCKPCETYVRVMVPAVDYVFDIPLTQWQRLCEKSDKLLKRAAAKL